MSSHPDYDEKVEALLESHQFSPAFYRLCTGLEDFDGLVAYGIYKDHKRKALLEKPLRRNDASFHKIHHHLNDGQRETLWQDAQQRLKVYADKVIEDATPRIQRDYIKTHIAKRERWQFWKGVGASMAASLAMMVLLNLAPWFAEQNPVHLADALNQRLQRIEAAIAPETGSFDTFEEIEPAAGAEPDLGEGHLFDDACLTDSDTLNDPACRGDY